MDLKFFKGKMVTLILDANLAIPGIDYYATKTDETGSHNLMLPQLFTLHPDKALYPEGNVILNAMVINADDSVCDLLYRPWAPSEMRGPQFHARIRNSDVRMVMVCIEPPLESEYAAVLRENERKRMEEATQTTSLVGQPRVATSGF